MRQNAAEFWLLVLDNTYSEWGVNFKFIVLRVGAVHSLRVALPSAAASLLIDLVMVHCTAAASEF